MDNTIHTEKNSCSALTVSNVSFAYKKKPVLHDISFTVPRGSICGLLGHNGSGKTTFFKCCMNILGSYEGRIEAYGDTLQKLSPAKLAQHIAYVPQEYRQIFPFTVRDVVAMGRTPHMAARFGGFGYATATDREHIQNALEQTNLTHLAEESCNTLSSGQRQLVFIARALAQNSPIMLLDEPTSALDFNKQVAVWTLLQKIAAQGISILVCCHDPNHILWFCDKVIVLHQGAILASGAPNTVLDLETLHTIYGSSCALGTTHVVYPSAHSSINQ